MKLAKKVLGAKKAWKSLTSRVQSKLDISKAKKCAGRILTGLSSIRRRVLVSWKRLRKRRTFKKSFPAVRCDHHNYERYDQEQQVSQKGFAAIYVDQLFAEDGGGGGGPGKGKEVVAESTGDGDSGKGERSGWIWKAAVASSEAPQFRGVDERAEEFISKFHQNVELEREKSILDFQDMLKRSA